MLEKLYSDQDVLEARARLWHMSSLEWKLDNTQKNIYNFIHDKTDKTLVVNASRRLGKSYILIILAFEQCLKHPKSIVKFLQPEVKMIRTNIRPIIDEIVEDCPLELRPEYKTQDNIYVFPNGSQIQLAGTDNGNYMKLRGGNTHLAIIDEAGFCTDLEHIINYILIPTTTLTKGQIILSSTTPPNPDHEFIKYMEYAEQQNRLIRKTIYDAVEENKGEIRPRITEGVVGDIIKSMKLGVDDPAFKTEYLCEVNALGDNQVLPEFTKDVQQDTIASWVRPTFYDSYVSMDIGFDDLTFVIFAYYDFDNSVIVIEDEFYINGPQLTAKTLSEGVNKIEADLWTNRLTGEFKKPYIRISDNNLIFINELSVNYDLHFIPTDKHNKDAHITSLRNLINDRRIIINPRCKRLISHMKGATWDKTRKDFKRSLDGSHYDGVAALMYLVRNIDTNKSPYPKGYRYSRLGRPDNVFINTNYKKPETAYEKMEKMMVPKRSSFGSRKVDKK